MSDPMRSPYEPEPTVPLDPRPAQPGFAEPHPQSRYPAPYTPPQGYGQSVPDPAGYGEPNPYEQYPQAPYQPAPYPSAPYQPAVYLQPVDPRQLAYQQSLYNAQKSRVAAGLLAIFLGTLGIHNFYLGRTGIAVTQLLITVLTLGLGSIVTSVWALIEGILILTRSPSFATDAKGIPLRD
ncbi:NINE protein [uncultured Friedmanniella sp.]|uniref:TM2 domain-containing protein n=1 Tax=uncultured Friedmanniella sp. TaxID=335381 RepID=UPI0035CA186D